MAGKTPKYIQERKASRNQERKKRSQRRSIWNWEWWIPLLISVLGAFLTIVGIIATTRARPTVSLEPPLDPDNVNSTQFVIVNDTWFDFRDMKAAGIMKNYKTSFIQEGGVMTTGWDTIPIPPDLNADERSTIPSPLRSIGLGGTIFSGEFGLIISYRPKWLPFWERRRAFRFTIALQSDGRNRFEQQPGAEEIEKEYDKQTTFPN
jgi:hypothetical protein